MQCLSFLCSYQYFQFALIVVLISLLGACAETQFIAQTVKKANKKHENVKTSNGIYKIGNPYQIKGVWYYPKENFEYDETGIGSWYGSKFHGRKTANGEIFNMNEISAAHRTLQMPSFVRVTNLENGRTLNVRVNDRGPYARGRILDLSRKAADLLGFKEKGTARIRVKVLREESLALARKWRGEAVLVKGGSPITVNSLPKIKVSSQNLPLVGSKNKTYEKPEEKNNFPKPQIREKRSDQLETFKLSGKVTLEPVPKSTGIFIQAGAFSDFENANRVHASLSSLGKVRVTSVLINGRDLFRVRLGPLNSVSDADHYLEQVIEFGYTDARTIVD